MRCECEIMNGSVVGAIAQMVDFLSIQLAANWFHIVIAEMAKLKCTVDKWKLTNFDLPTEFEVYCSLVCYNCSILS
jgi:sporulation-control protein spo0M